MRRKPNMAGNSRHLHSKPKLGYVCDHEERHVQ